MTCSRESNLPDPVQPAEKRRVALALQGGGSHGAFTWGVLDRLLAEPSLEIVGISGTSAGAMNAGVLADGLRVAGPRRPASLTIVLAGCRAPSGIRELVAMGSAGHVAPRPQSYLPLGGYADAGLLAIPDRLLQLPSRSARCCSASTSKGCAMMRARRASSYAQRTYAPDCVACSTMPNYRLTCCSPRRACRRRIKRSRSGTTSFGTGGYTGNPALAPLYLGTNATDLIVVGINPIERTDRASDSARHHRPNRRDQFQLDLHA